MDHVAERGGLDEEDIGHCASAGAHIPSIKHDRHNHVTGVPRTGLTRLFTPRPVQNGARTRGARGHDDPGHRRRRLYRQPHGARAGRRRRARWSCSTICRPDFASWCPARCRSSSATTGDRELVGADHRASTASTPSSISPPRSWCRIRSRDPLGYYRNNTVNTCAPARRRDRRPACSISSSPRPPRSTAMPSTCRCARTQPTGADLALRHVEADVGDHAARRRRARTACASWCCATSTSPAPIRSCAPASRRRGATHLIKVAVRGRARQARQDRRLRHRLSDAGRHLHPRLHPRQRSRARAFGGARAICAAAAPARRSTAATATALRCSR